MTAPLHVVTGAFGFSGARIARRLLDRGHPVRTLTGHPRRPHPLQGQVKARPFTFQEPEALARALEGAAVLHNTYWIRFEGRGRTFARAVRHSRALFRAAREAGIRRIVHVSITNPCRDSSLPYFRGKALVEAALRRTGVPHSILRPALLFGRGDVLVNNVAWLVRRSPVFAVPGDGSYPVRPIHVNDLAAVAVAEAERAGDRVVDAVGPDRFAFEEMVRTVAAALDARVRLVHVPPRAALALARLVGRIVDDVVLTADEVRGLTRGLLGSAAPAAGTIRLGPWIREHGEEVGRRWASELERHYRDRVER